MRPGAVDVDRRLAEAFQAPEGVWNRDADRIRLDVFALGALAYYVLAGRPAAADRAALRERLHRDGGPRPGGGPAAGAVGSPARWCWRRPGRR